MRGGAIAATPQDFKPIKIKTDNYRLPDIIFHQWHKVHTKFH
jgi:hypothetical protein